MHTPTHFLQAIKAAVNGITAIMNNPDFIYYLFFRHEEDQMCRQNRSLKSLLAYLLPAPLKTSEGGTYHLGDVTVC